MSRESLAAEIDLQSRACSNLGSPLYAGLMARARDDARSGGIVADLLAPYAGLPVGAAVTLRLFGAVHRLALCGVAPELARDYPSCGGRTNVDPDTVWPAFEAVCREHREQIAERLGQAPQTNEVGRAAALRGALDLVSAAAGALPTTLREIGASAGLNLLLDKFRLEWADGMRGPVDSPVRLTNAFTGDAPAESRIDVADRLGCDINPLTATDADDALTLESFVWADQPQRFERLRGAIQIACETELSVVDQSADEFLATIAPAPGTLTVISHSVMWQYLPDAVRARATDELHRLSEAARVDAPVAHISLEPPRSRDDADVDFRAARRAGGFVISAACWPRFGNRVVGYCPPHGPPAHWL